MADAAPAQEKPADLLADLPPDLPAELFTPGLFTPGIFTPRLFEFFMHELAACSLVRGRLRGLLKKLASETGVRNPAPRKARKLSSRRALATGPHLGHCLRVATLLLKGGHAGSDGPSSNTREGRFGVELEREQDNNEENF